MQWNKMTKRQQDAARRIAQKLHEAGVTDGTASQVAKHFEQAIAWEGGEITLADLCETTGWSLPPAADPLDAVREAKTKFLAARSALRQAMRNANSGGASANKIAEALDGVYSRPTVLRVLGVESLEDKARRLLATAGYDDDHCLVLTERDATTITLTTVNLDADDDPDAPRKQNTITLTYRARDIIDVLTSEGIDVHDGSGWTADLDSHLAGGKTAYLSQGE